MRNWRISLGGLPPEGRQYVVDDPAVWQEPLELFHMDCRVRTPLRADISVLPLEGGWLVRGALKGEAVLPCARCAEDAAAPIDTRFEDFAAMPGDETDDDGDAAEETAAGRQDGDDARVALVGGVPHLDLAAVCWEEFLLALPLAPLCRPDCKGLCARCGANLNEGACACPKDEGDPRLAVLRGLKVRNN